MSDLLTDLGFVLDTDLGIFVFCCSWTAFMVVVIWVIGCIRGEHSLMDGYYGFAFAVPAWFAFWLGGNGRSQTAAALLLMVSLHGCRLGVYMFCRWRRFTKTVGGDPRYLAWARQYQPGYWWKSFFMIMAPQALVIILIGLPAVVGILGTATDPDQLGLLAAVGMTIFGVGYYFETVADGQLQAFLADDQRTRRYIQTGVWTYSRHPNYFGNVTVWWGIWIVAVAGNADIWWTVVGPIANTVMLTMVLGSALADKHMGDRPEYQEVMRKTRKFLPLPLRARPDAPSSPPTGPTEEARADRA